LMGRRFDSFCRSYFARYAETYRLEAKAPLIWPPEKWVVSNYNPSSEPELDRGLFKLELENLARAAILPHGFAN